MKILAAFLLCGSLGAAPVMLKIRIKPSVANSTIEIPLEKYVAAVLAGECSTFRSGEAMKAMAVAAMLSRP